MKLQYTCQHGQDCPCAAITVLKYFWSEIQSDGSITCAQHFLENWRKQKIVFVFFSSPCAKTVKVTSHQCDPTYLTKTFLFVIVVSFPKGVINLSQVQSMPKWVCCEVNSTNYTADRFVETWIGLNFVSDAQWPLPCFL